MEGDTVLVRQKERNGQGSWLERKNEHRKVECMKDKLNGINEEDPAERKSNLEETKAGKQ
jgi:hypothetical protein